MSEIKMNRNLEHKCHVLSVATQPFDRTGGTMEVAK